MQLHVLGRALNGSRHALFEGSCLTRSLWSATTFKNTKPFNFSADVNTRASSHQQASSSGNTPSVATQEWISSTSSFSQQQFRGIKVLRRQFELPPEIQAIVDRKMEIARQPRPAAIAPELAARSLTAESVRSGCIAYKAGMTQEWDEYGARVPLTVLWVDDCQVVAVKTEESYGYTALQLGGGHIPQRWAHPKQEGYFLKQGVPVKEELVEFKVTPDALMPVGTHIGASHFVAGQNVDVTGWTKWKGFQGVMKKWNFKGQPASHGVSLSHRSPGSIGCRTDPGKVFKGKKMPGNMGDERRTVRNCLVYKVDPARNLVYVRGQVPGPAGHVVLLKDTRVSHERRATLGLPFPTSLPQAGAEAGITVAKTPLDPYKPFSAETDYFEVRWKKSD